MRYHALKTTPLCKHYKIIGSTDAMTFGHCIANTSTGNDKMLCNSLKGLVYCHLVECHHRRYGYSCEAGTSAISESTRLCNAFQAFSTCCWVYSGSQRVHRTT